MKTYFWGIFLISSGIFLVLKYYLNLNISTARVVIGLFIICIGISILIGGYGYSDSSKLIFSSGRLKPTSADREYSIVFSQGTLDLSDISIDTIKRKIEVNTVFATSEIILPKDASVYIEANAAFASTAFPNGSRLTFGDRVYTHGADTKSEADIVVELNTVFGSTNITQR